MVRKEGKPFEPRNLPAGERGALPQNEKFCIVYPLH